MALAGGIAAGVVGATATRAGKGQMVNLAAAAVAAAVAGLQPAAELRKTMQVAVVRAETADTVAAAAVVVVVVKTVTIGLEQTMAVVARAAQREPMVGWVKQVKLGTLAVRLPVGAAGALDWGVLFLSGRGRH